MEENKTYSKFKRSQWDSINYGEWFKSSKGRLVDLLEKEGLIKALGNSNYENLLDVGIANGRQIQVYQNYIKNLVAIDISPEQLKLAKKESEKYNISSEFIVCDDSSTLDFPDNTFDCVLCTRVLQHVFDWKSSISEFKRVLKPNGELILITYNRFSIYGLLKLIQHLMNSDKGRFRNPIQLISELKKNDFSIMHYSGAMISQFSILPNFLINIFYYLLVFIERFSNVLFFKYIGERQIIKARINK